MPPLTTRPPSLCLFCRFKAIARPHRLGSHTQRVYQSAASASRREERRDENSTHIRKIRGGRGLSWAGHFNPLKTTRTSASKLETSVWENFEKLRREIRQSEYLEGLALTPDQFETEWAAFQQYIRVWLKKVDHTESNVLGDRMRGKTSLKARLRYLFHTQVFGKKFTKAEIDNQKDLANLRYPAEWFPAARSIPRTVHLHVGPTNSGKTYHALKRLEEAESGIYLGPLRLLAHEVYSRLNAKGKPCALVTGEEQRIPEAGNTKMWSCTVEMAPLNIALDVAVIDEIQMINHRDRGWAWTEAFLGIQAKEIHLCGEARTVPLMKELCALVHDKVVIHEYERLTPLQTAGKSLNGQLSKNLQKGDCVVAFSVLGIHALRRTIETSTGRKCAIVYGSLPPETRAQQARLFNDPTNDYDFLVASDAIGMGLNLSIKRVIFESTMKNNGVQILPLEISEIKQIAGRAGRYRTAHQDMEAARAQGQNNTPSDVAEDNTIGLDDAKPDDDVQPISKDNTTVGYATTLDSFDMPYLKRCMESEPLPIKSAGLFPPSIIVERFANYFPPGTPFSYILIRLHEISDLHPRFHLCSLKDHLAIADTIHGVKGLTIQERLLICAAPTNVREPQEQNLLRALAECIADTNNSGNLLDLPIPLEILDNKPSAERRYLYELEQLHKMLVIYLWLSYRFPNVFTTRGLANYAKKLVEDAIENTLNTFNFTEGTMKMLRAKRKAAMEEFNDTIDNHATPVGSNHRKQVSKFAQQEERPANISIAEPHVEQLRV